MLMGMRVIMLGVIMLGVIMLGVIMLGVIVLGMIIRSMMCLTVVMVGVLMMRVVMVPMVMVRVVLMAVHQLGRRDRGADCGRPMQRARRRNEGAPFHPEQTKPDQHDQRVAYDLDHIDRAAHGPGAGIEQRGGDANEHHRDQRLQQRRGKR